MNNNDTTFDLYNRSTVIDGLHVSNWTSPAVYQSLRFSNITAINATIAVFEGFNEAADNIKSWLKRLTNYNDSFLHVTSVKDITQAKFQKKTGIIFGWQNASPIEDDLNRLELFHRLGVRIIQLTYNERNRLGNGCWERNDDGLSKFGLDALHEMNRLGILVDLSHCGDITTQEAIEFANSPVAVTHANARSFYHHPRNKPDHILRLLVERGGVIGATSWPPFLRNKFNSSIIDFVDAIDDLVERVGIDHVGIGSDYTQNQTKEWFDVLMSQQGTKFNQRRLDYPDVVTHPTGIETPDKFPVVSIELVNRGYSEEDVAKILGGNWLRLFSKVWAV